VKLIRVTLLAPVVLIFALCVRQLAKDSATEGKRPPIMPAFVVFFLILAAISSVVEVPSFVVEPISDVSRWSLLAAIAAVGMKTSLRRMAEVGRQAVILIVAETLFIAALILAGILYLAP